MKIYESAVRKPVSTVLLFVGVIVFGLFSLMNLAVDQYPEIEIPQISVITMYPGANAADIETNITRVLEDNLNTVNNLKKLTSKSQDNVSMITVEFEYGSDLNEGANEIRDVVSRVQSMLPDDIDYPTIFKFSTSMIPVMMIAVTAEESYPALNKLLDDKLVNVLNRGTIRCPDMSAIGRELDMLYGAQLAPSVRKKGENQLFGFAASCIDDRFLPKGEKLLEKLTDLLGEFCCNPITRGGRLL